MTSLLSREAQSLNPSSVIHLFTLDASNVGGAIHRFCTEREADGSPVMFGGNQFPQISVKTEGFEWNSDGTLPRPKMSASALNDTFYSLIVLTNGAQGALLLRERTLAKFLDGHEYGGRGIKFSSDLYIVDRVTTLTKSLVTLELITPLDLPRCRVLFYLIQFCSLLSPVMHLFPYFFRKFINHIKIAKEIQLFFLIGVLLIGNLNQF